MKCEICKKREAKYDARTRDMVWKYMCETCFENLECSLGLGNGQRLTRDNTQEVWE